MYSGDEYYGDDVTSPLERPLFSGYKGGPLMNPLARIQKDTTMTPQEALEFLDGARFENYSGQIIAEHANKNKDFIVCELSCTCSEVASKNADEYGEVLVTLLNSVKGLLAQQGTFTRMIAEVCDHNEILYNALRLIAKNEASTLDVRGIARDALNAVKPIDADE
jgi:hypothetical protein